MDVLEHLMNPFEAVSMLKTYLKPNGVVIASVPNYVVGSNSIKQVLPAVLNASQFLQEKYSKPIYGSEIPSLNIDASNPIAWISIKDGVVENPYKKLPPVNEYLNLSDKEISAFATQASDNEDGFTVDEGGAAMTAYSKLQFSDTTMSDALVKALYRYCELDTMAMVFVWEYFNKECME